ncbi:7 transmembrane sweet-taste receptor of 3 GCPR-domain-containing protein [Halteromyces radiatus]|uniref:7 transmembrane sweet-taste receptor of 3 GCPR-domain-containing protein n=1 Tax=Halteromyces radiatus TaxID=101107 RepID=UPI00221F6106|nr:7 transmembrane sweet-taste receptor of 3 GCPR-domain-containing protein [Halteromyces radiatus]KAI8083134.1 7 transmembrane sweet-taste receptor of 3 GCPR-domain-containing protein [Halteromyces radiatus]
MIVAAIGSLFAVSVFIIVVIFRKNEIFKAASPLFCCLELIGFIFTYASVVMMIGPPSQTTCIAMPISFSLGLLLVLSNMIAKNYRIYRIFNNIFISRTVITDLQLIKSVTVMMGIDLIILVIGLIVVTPYPEKVSVSLTQYYWSCNVEHPSKLVFAGLLCSYNGILLIFATFLAYKTRLAGKHYSRYSECRQMGLSIYNILFSAIVGFVVLVNPMADYYTKYYISVVTVLWATTFSLLILFLPKLQAFIQQRRQEKDKENEKLSVASHLIAAAAATVGFGTTGEGHTTTTTTTTHHHQKQQQQALLSTNHLQKKQHSFYHMGSKENDHNAMELLSLEEILGSNAPALFRRSIHNNKYDSSISNNNNNHEGYIENIGRNHGSYVEVYEADVPARKVLRYLPSLSQWEMLHIMVFPWLGYFSYISKNAKQGRVMTYHHASVYTAELENYVLKIHGQGMYDMYIQVPDLKTLELWEKRLNQRHQEQQGNLSFLATPPAASSAASSVRRPLRSNTIEPEDLSEDNQPSFFRRSSTSFDETTGDRHMVEPINRDQHRISLDSSPTYSGSSTMIPYSINRSNNSSNDSNHIH